MQSKLSFKRSRYNMSIQVADGNAFSFIGAGRKALIRSGREEDVAAFTEEMTSGDYNHLIQTFLKWFPDAEIAE
jgi:hypothetical protein